jgi:hypothetical protein
MNGFSPTGYWAVYVQPDQTDEIFIPVVDVHGGVARVINEEGYVVAARDETVFGTFRVVVSYFEG